MDAILNNGVVDEDVLGEKKKKKMILLSKRLLLLQWGWTDNNVGCIKRLSSRKSGLSSSLLEQDDV